MAEEHSRRVVEDDIGRAAAEGSADVAVEHSAGQVEERMDLVLEPDSWRTLVAEVASQMLE